MYIVYTNYYHLTPTFYNIRVYQYLKYTNNIIIELAKWLILVKS